MPWATRSTAPCSAATSAPEASAAAPTSALARDPTGTTAATTTPERSKRVDHVRVYPLRWAPPGGGLLAAARPWGGRGAQMGEGSGSRGRMCAWCQCLSLT
eukprot:scaffold33294_cov65-Phaeocystis_antarctica.AAC.3